MAYVEQDDHTPACINNCATTSYRYNTLSVIYLKEKLYLSFYVHIICSDKMEDVIVSDVSSMSSVSEIAGQRGKSFEELMKEMDCLEISSDYVSETPDKVKPEGVKTPLRQVNNTPAYVIMETPVHAKTSSMKTPSSITKTPFSKKPAIPPQTSSLKRPTVKPNLSVKSKSVLATPSPVGLYIRSLPEPMLIENVRSVNKKVIQSTPSATKPIVAVKNKDGRWSIARSTPHSSTKENIAEKTVGEFKAVLPTVLHEAAAYMVILHLHFKIGHEMLIPFFLLY